MYGADIGTLNVDVYDGTWHEGVWSISGQRQASSTDAYTKATVDLSSYTGTIKLRIRAVAAGGYRGDIAIDDITVSGAEMPYPPEFSSDPVVLGDALEGSLYSVDLTGIATDPTGQDVTYTITDGPGWLRADGGRYA